MNKYNRLLSEIASELNIVKGIKESENCWKARTIYSAIGHLALASLYDIQEDDIPISITHFKRKIDKLYLGYLSMYPEMNSVFIMKPEAFSTEIYKILLKTGNIYHSSYRITAPITSTATCEHLSFMRGVPLDIRVFRSGLGAYVPTGDKSEEKNIYQVYGLHMESLADYWSSLTREITRYPAVLHKKTEYLRIKPPYNYGYFKNSPDTDGRISLARSGMQGSYTYYFYRFHNSEMEIAQLPRWQVDNDEYRQISNSCLFNYGKLPTIRYHIDGDIVEIRLQYLLPPAEQNLIRLYSWPRSYACSFSNFSQVMALTVFMELKKVFEQIGYRFTEE